MTVQVSMHKLSGVLRGFRFPLAVLGAAFIAASGHAIPAPLVYVIPQQHSLQTGQVSPAAADQTQNPTASAAPATAAVDEKPAPLTTVDWDTHKLRIVANDASVEDILKQVSSKTGAALRGVDAEQHVFGTYGPGPARDVLSELLEGLGYNVMLIGDQGHGAPRFIVLSARPAMSQQPRQSYNAPAIDDNADIEPELPPAPPPTIAPQAPNLNNGAPAAQVKTPQEMMQEIQQRLLQLQQQQTSQPQPQP